MVGHDLPLHLFQEGQAGAPPHEGQGKVDPGLDLPGPVLRPVHRDESPVPVDRHRRRLVVVHDQVVDPQGGELGGSGAAAAGGASPRRAGRGGGQVGRARLSHPRLVIPLPSPPPAQQPLGRSALLLLHVVFVLLVLFLLSVVGIIRLRFLLIAVLLPLLPP